MLRFDYPYRDKISVEHELRPNGAWSGTLVYNVSNVFYQISRPYGTMNGENMPFLPIFCPKRDKRKVRKNNKLLFYLVFSKEKVYFAGKNILS